MQPGIPEKVKSLRLTFSSAALMGRGGGELSFPHSFCRPRESLSSWEFPEAMFWVVHNDGTCEQGTNTCHPKSSFDPPQKVPESR